MTSLSFLSSLLKTQDHRTGIMGILNSTPDSFFGGSLVSLSSQKDEACRKIEGFINAGVDIIDIGGESTNPRATPVSLEEELNRVLPLIDFIRQNFDIPLSIDTIKATVAREALKLGVHMINDVSGMMLDSNMASVAVEYNVPVVLTHSSYKKDTKQLDHTRSTPQGYNVHIVDIVIEELNNMITHALNRGVDPSHIILDPGIGFGKSAQENLALLKHLGRIRAIGYPVLLGVSRKVVIVHITGAAVEDRLPGSLALATVGILNGADIIRVHDVAESKQVAQMVDALKRV